MTPYDTEGRVREWEQDTGCHVQCGTCLGHTPDAGWAVTRPLPQETLAVATAGQRPALQDALRASRALRATGESRK